MMYGSGNQQGRLHPVRHPQDDRRQPGRPVKLLKDMPVGDKGSSNQDFGWMMWEAFKYFGGGNGTP